MHHHAGLERRIFRDRGSHSDELRPHRGGLRDVLVDVAQSSRQRVKVGGVVRMELHKSIRSSTTPKAWP